MSSTPGLDRTIKLVERLISWGENENIAPGELATACIGFAAMLALGAKNPDVSVTRAHELLDSFFIALRETAP